MIRIKIKYKPKPIVKIPHPQEGLYAQLQNPNAMPYNMGNFNLDMVKTAMADLYYGKTKS